MGRQRRPLWSRFGTQPRPPAAEGSWRHGAAGLGLRARLDELPRPAWVVVHDLPLGGGRTLDHLVIGPPRTFAVSAVHATDIAARRNVAAGDDDRLAALRAAAEVVDNQLRGATGLAAHVEPVAVLHGPLVLLDRPPVGVTVLASVEVPGWFLGQSGQRLDPRAVTTLEAAARAVGGPHRAPRPQPASHTTGARARSSAVTVTRWRGVGHDRWYVNLADGTTLGHLDTATGAVVVERPEDESLVRAALRANDAPLP